MMHSRIHSAAFSFDRVRFTEAGFFAVEKTQV